MTDEACWAIIDAAHAQHPDDVDALVTLLVETLRKRPVEDIFAFSAWVRQKMLDACLPDVLLACEWIAGAEGFGPLSGDGWEYWRGWIVARGRRGYEAVLTDADVLADLFTDVEQMYAGEAVEYSGIYAFGAARGGEPDLTVAP